MDASFAADYAELDRWHWWFRARRRILETVLRRELSPPPRRLLSLGCGPPSGLHWLLPLTAEGTGEVVGVDADPSGSLLHLVARQRDGLPARLSFVFGSLEAPPVRVSSCDAILLMDVLEHLEDDVASLARAAGLLRPGGLLLVTVPALPSLWGRQDVVAHHYRRYTRRALNRLFLEAGAPRPRLSYFNSLLFPPIALVRWSRRLLGRSDGGRSDFAGGRPGRLNDGLAWLFALERHWVGRNSFGAPVGVSLLATVRVP